MCMRTSCDAFAESNNNANRKVCKWFIKKLDTEPYVVLLLPHGKNHTTYRRTKNFKYPGIRAYGISDKQELCQIRGRGSQWDLVEK